MNGPPVAGFVRLEVIETHGERQLRGSEREARKRMGRRSAEEAVQRGALVTSARAAWSAVILTGGPRCTVAVVAGTGAAAIASEGCGE